MPKLHRAENSAAAASIWSPLAKAAIWALPRSSACSTELDLKWQNTAAGRGNRLRLSRLESVAHDLCVLLVTFIVSLPPASCGEDRPAECRVEHQRHPARAHRIRHSRERQSVLERGTSSAGQIGGVLWRKGVTVAATGATYPRRPPRASRKGGPGDGGGRQGRAGPDRLRQPSGSPLTRVGAGGTAILP